ncbi:MAG TPA: hypothetical protein VFX46_06470 [Hyphomicrobiaceae bacterium]|jgi:hypothetical protein|nr:hypothetical protein [Hyphomicrobiaceae bacterium]
MSKFVSELSKAKAPFATHPSTLQHQPRPRLAERLAALAPLARAPLIADVDRDEPDGLSRLPHTTRSRSYQPNALVPLEPPQLPLTSEPPMLSPVGVAPLHLDFDDDARAELRLKWLGFFVGLAISAAIGVGLYVALA